MSATIIGVCTTVADRLEHEAELWRSMEDAMGIAYSKLSDEKRARVKTLLERIPVGELP